MTEMTLKEAIEYHESHLALLGEEIPAEQLHKGFVRNERGIAATRKLINAAEAAERLAEALEWIANFNACDYKYRSKGQAALQAYSEIKG